MLLNNKTLLDELKDVRSKKHSELEILAAVKSILKENEEERVLIKDTLLSKSSTNQNNFDFDLLETDKIYHIEDIKKVCINFRLRFLDSSMFVNTIPEEAITKISNLEKSHQTNLEGFKIVAPSKAFALLHYDDPLLFAPIGNDYYYLIHKWGKDLDWYRKYLVWPIKNLLNFVIFCGFVSLAITLISPVDNLAKTVPLAPFILFLFMFKAVIASTAYYFFLSGKNFNSEIWNRKFKEN
jgi:hypothetical protein